MNYFLTSLFCLFFSALLSQTVVIKGEAKPYKGKEIRAVVYEDFITETEKEIASTVVSDSGYFQLSFISDKIQYVWLKSEGVKSDLHAEPGKTYDVVLFAKDTTRYQNPSIEQLVDLAMLKTDTTEVNYLVADFNRKFDLFWMNNYKYFIVDQLAYEKVDSFRLATKKSYASINNPYFQNYLTYKIAALQDATSENRKKMFNDYINGKPILYNDYEYMNFLGKYYTPVIRTMMFKNDYIKELTQRDNFKNFAKLFKSNDYLKNDTIREFAAIKALYVSYNYPMYTNGNILHMLQAAAKEALGEGNRKIAENIVKKISKLTTGAPAPPFRLLDKNDKIVSLEDYKGKYVYLDFWATWCAPCLAEMKLMPELKKEYGNQIEFISISIDENIDLMKNFLKKNPQYNWTFLYTGNKGNTKDDYMVYSVPTYYLINSFGKLMQSPAGTPSGDIEKIFDELLKKK